MVLIVRAWLEGDGRLTVRLIDTMAANRNGIYVNSIEAAETVLRERLTNLVKERHTDSR